MAPPLYKIVFDKIIARITSGELKPGAMLPSEVDLAKEMGVSQGTARKALVELELRGLVHRKQGKGTFVTIHTPESSLFHFFRLRKLDGTREQPLLVSESVSKRPATAEEKELLPRKPDVVYVVERVRSLSGMNVIFEKSVVPRWLFPDLPSHTPLPNTLYVYYQQAYSCVIMRAEEGIRTKPADDRTAEALGIPAGTCVLDVVRHSIDLQNRIVEIRSSAYLTEHHKYGVTLF